MKQIALLGLMAIVAGCGLPNEMIPPSCKPDCAGKCGGADGCSGACPDNCVTPQTCGGSGAQYVCGCTPDCSGRCGGSDGCGGNCPDNCVAPLSCGGGGSLFICGTITINCGSSPTGKGGDMCDVPGGPFMMGCNEAVDTECVAEEKPYHAVDVPSFKIDKNEVTTFEYGLCTQTGACTRPITGGQCAYAVSGMEHHPVDCVTWEQAKAYCTWAGKRLPTEAEWEKAARGTDGRKYPWGNTGLDCNHAVQNSTGCEYAGTAPVGSTPAGASPYGVEDMCGNVMQWVEDDWHHNYQGAPVDGSAWVEHTRGSYRVYRSAIYGCLGTVNFRSSFRGELHATGWFGAGGFRCAMSAP